MTVQLSPHLLRFSDSCEVYALTSGRHAVLVDIGTGDVLDQLADYGIEQVTDVLVTHHHRDQVQGLPRAAAAGARIWVPESERDLIGGVEEFWATRGLDTSYNPRQDRFSLIESVPVHGLLPAYRDLHLGGFDIRTLPTPGHTAGSASLFAEVDGQRVGFTGDLLYGPGRVWSLAALQWTYTGHGGIAATVLSMHHVLEQAPDLLLPSHGEPMTDPAAAVAATEEPLRRLLDSTREHPWDLDDWRRRPFEEITPHLLRNRTANAQYYALLSDSGTALFVDFATT